MSNQPDNWLQLLQQLKQGDRIALLKITRVITGYLTRYQAYQLRDSWDDLTQEVLMALIKGADQIQHEQAFISYIGTITRNKLVDWVKKQKRTGSDELLGDPDAGLAILDNNNADNCTEQDELIDLQAALDSLPEREKKAVTAIYIQGHSYAAAADLLNIPFGTLKRLQTQGLKQLRQIMLKKGQGTLSESSSSTDLSDKAATGTSSV